MDLRLVESDAERVLLREEAFRSRHCGGLERAVELFEELKLLGGQLERDDDVDSDDLVTAVVAP